MTTRLRFTPEIFLLVVMPLLVSCAFAALYGQAFTTSLLFFAGLALTSYLPGRALLMLAGPQFRQGAFRDFWALGLGVVCWPLLYWVLRTTHVSDTVIWLVMGLAAIAGCVAILRDARPTAERLSWKDGLMLSGLLVVVFVLGHFSHFTDFAVTAGGVAYRSHFLAEGAFHEGIVNALRDGFPAPSLYFSRPGSAVFYHYGMHLQMEVLNRLLAVPTAPLIYLYWPFVYLGCLAVLPYALYRTLGASAVLASALALLIFGSDLSFLLNLWFELDDRMPWNLYLFAPVSSLFSTNGALPAAVALVVAIALVRETTREPRVGHYVLLALVVLAALNYKSSMGLQIAGSFLGMWVLSGFLQGWSRRTLAVAGVMLLTLVASLAYLFFWMGRGGAGDNIHLQIMSLMGPVMSGLRWLPKSPLALVGSLILIMLLAMGPRCLALASISRHRLSEGGWPVQLNLYLAIFVLGGILLSEVLFIGPLGGRNNGIWFASHALVAGWVWLAVWLCSLAPRKAAWLVALSLLLSWPATVQFLHIRHADQQIVLSRNSLMVVDALRQVPPGSIVLHPLNVGVPAMASNLAGRPSVLNVYRSFVRYFAGAGSRVQDVNEFFGDGIGADERGAMLVKYQVDYLYIPAEEAELVAGLSNLERLVGNPEWQLYRVNRPAN